MTELDFTPFADAIQRNNSFVLFGHINPDGDSIGALCAMALILEYAGKTDVQLYSRDGVPGFLKFLPSADRIKDKTGMPAELPAEPVPARAALLLDCGGIKRIGEEFGPMLKGVSEVIVVDHHETNGGFGNVNLIDPQASSTCEIIARYAGSEGIVVSPEMATAIYTGMMYDTGRFLHSNTTAEVFGICADLVKLGAHPSDIATKVFKQRSPARQRLLGYALNNMQTAEDNAIAWAVLDRPLFAELGAKDEDTEGIVEELGAYEGCEVHIVFGKTPEGRTRVSMRSTGRVSVGDICASFGGGGHKFAAGFRSKEPLDAVVEQAIARTVDALRKLNAGAE